MKGLTQNRLYYIVLCLNKLEECLKMMFEEQIYRCDKGKRTSLNFVCSDKDNNYFLKDQKWNRTSRMETDHKLGVNNGKEN